MYMVYIIIVFRLGALLCVCGRVSVTAMSVLCVCVMCGFGGRHLPYITIIMYMFREDAPPPPPPYLRLSHLHLYININILRGPCAFSLSLSGSCTNMDVRHVFESGCHTDMNRHLRPLLMHTRTISSAPSNTRT